MDLEKVSEQIQKALKKGDWKKVADLQKQVQEYENRFQINSLMENWNEETKDGELVLEIVKEGFSVKLNKEEQLELIKVLKTNECLDFRVPF